MVTIELLFRISLYLLLIFPRARLQTDPTDPPENELVSDPFPISTYHPVRDSFESTTGGISSSSSSEAPVPISIEILRIYIPSGMGNAVKLIWGNRHDLNLNLTYGVHYGINEESLGAPRLTTTNVSALIEDLEYCTKYFFAVTLSKSNNKINPNNVRSIITDADHLAPPEDLQVEFEGREEPCLLIKWSASCANIDEPLGYLISTYEKTTARYFVVTVPKSKRSDFVYRLKVNYEEKFDINVSTSVPEAKTSENVTFHVPGFLQPYRVRVTSNPDGAFMIYWNEPYVPYYVGNYYYEVKVFRGADIAGPHEKFYVTRPVIIHKGDANVYTFTVCLVSHDRQFRSLFTDPVVANSNGDTRTIEVN